MNLPWKHSSSASPSHGSTSSLITSTSSQNKKIKSKIERKYFSVEDNRECIAMFFRFIDDQVKNMKKDNVSTTSQNNSSPPPPTAQTPPPSTHPSTRILFCIENGDINYLVTFGEGAQFIQLKLLEQYSPNCIVILDSYTMTKLARGVLKPMSAILGGQLKIEGDTKTFGEFTPILKASVKAMMEYNKTNFTLDVSILRTYEKTDESGSRHTEYVIRSLDRIGGNYWETPHRYADFVNFRKLLASRGYQNLPDLPRKHIIHSSVNPNVVRRRMEDLALFLQLVIIQIGSSEPNVVNFLGAYMTGTTQTINHLPLPTSQKKSNSSSVDNSLDGDTAENTDGLAELDAEIDDSDSFNNGSSLQDVVQMKHALKIAQEHAEFYVHESGRKMSITSAPFHSTSFSVDGESKSVDATTTGHPNQTSVLHFTPSSASLSTNSRTNTVRNEIFQLKRRIDELESNGGVEQSFTSSMASWFLHFLPRVTRWGTIMSLILGVAIPLLLKSSERFLTVYAAILESGIHLSSVSFLFYHAFASLCAYVLACVMITFIISMPFSRFPAGISLVIYILYPLLAPSLGLILRILENFVDPQSINAQQFCGIGVYLADRNMCSYSPTRIIMTSLSYIGYEILMRKGISSIFLTWLISIPITYSLHTMKNFGVKVFPAHPLTSILRCIMVCERLFSIYTPIATVVSAYIYLSIFLQVFGYATPTLITGTETSERKPFPDNFQRSFLDSNKNLTASAYHALDRVLAEYVLNEISSLKSIFIKVGQYVAGRPDLVSTLWSTTLSKLHDSCPTSSSMYIKTMVESCLTLTKNKDEKLNFKQKLFYQKKKLRSLDELFETFDMKPIASGCVAQYHQATMFIDGQLHDVIVKVQHPTIETLFEIDMNALKAIVTIATKFYSKWMPLLEVLKVWESSLKEELDFRVEAKNMIEAHQHMQKSGFGTCIPEPVRGYIHQKVLVTTRLRGFKITDKFSLTLHCVDTSSLICRIAHSLAYQMLVAGFFHADPHPGNIFCVEGKASDVSSSPFKKRPTSASLDQNQYYLDTPSSLDDSWRPGFLDFGMTHRLKDETRLLYCKLLISLQEEDAEGVSKALSSLGYVTNQSDRVPERDQEFFAFLFRDANDVKSAHLERKLFHDMRSAQQAEDASLSGNKDRSQRIVYEIPTEYFFISRTVGLLRGLSAIMNVRCPIIEIFTLQARVGIHQRNDNNNED